MQRFRSCWYGHLLIEMNSSVIYYLNNNIDILYFNYFLGVIAKYNFFHIQKDKNNFPFKSTLC